jgi:hypothetical protein
LNPMIKVINLISLLFSGVILSLGNTFSVEIPYIGPVPVLSIALSLVLIGIIGAAIVYSKRETKEEERALDVEGPIPSDILAEPNPVEVNADFVVNATLDDSSTGGSKIASAEYSLDGTTWWSMEPADGAMDTPIEKIVAKLSVTKAGVYKLQVHGSDELGNVASEKSIVLIVYDPDGIATGDGSIKSPVGAYTAGSTLTGKATFKFDVQYRKGDRLPTGQTEFTFSAADMTFKSTSYDWLVVSESKARCKGTGTINGSGKYGFMLIVVDENREENKSKKFRMKIWDKTTGKTVYDNNLGYPEDITPTTVVSGGNVEVNIRRERPEK